MIICSWLNTLAFSDLNGQHDRDQQHEYSRSHDPAAFVIWLLYHIPEHENIQYLYRKPNFWLVQRCWDQRKRHPHLCSFWIWLCKIVHRVTTHLWWISEAAMSEVFSTLTSSLCNLRWYTLSEQRWPNLKGILLMASTKELSSLIYQRPPLQTPLSRILFKILRRMVRLNLNLAQTVLQSVSSQLNRFRYQELKRHYHQFYILR